MIRRTRHFVHAGAIALAASVLLAGAALTADPHPGSRPSTGKSPVVTYVALGDSYAAGQGAGDYENACLQSAYSYPELLDAEKHVKLAADASCSGATTLDVTSTQLSALAKKKGVDLVTITVGANDLNGGTVAAVCSVAFASTECQAALGQAYALLLPPAPGVPSEISVRLASTHAAVAAAAPAATILVTGYPYLFETPPPASPGHDAIVQLNSAITVLNSTIEAAVAQLAATGVDIRYVDVTAAFAGHGIGSPDPWINAAGPDVVHPTVEGYEAYAAALEAAR
jgi:lysophospholipase L1-like esterase